MSYGKEAEQDAEFDALQRRVKRLEDVVAQLVHINDTGPHLLAQAKVKHLEDECYCSENYICRHHSWPADHDPGDP